MQDLSFLGRRELRNTLERLQQAVEEIEYCLVTVQEEHEELVATNEMLKLAVQTLKVETPKDDPRQWPKAASKEWQRAMNEILMEQPPVIEKHADPHEPDCEPVLAKNEAAEQEEAKEVKEETPASFQAEEFVSLPKHAAKSKSYKDIKREVIRKEVKRPSQMRRTKVVRY